MDPTQQYPRTAELQLSCDWQDPYHRWSLLTRCKMHDKIYCTVVGESKFEDRRQDMGWFLTRTSSSNSWSHHCLLNMLFSEATISSEATGKPGSAGSPLMRSYWDTKLAMAHANGMRRGASTTPATEGFVGHRCGRKGSEKGSTTVLNRDTFSEEVFFSPDRSSLAC